jgi:hypothetical protein
MFFLHPTREIPGCKVVPLSPTPLSADGGHNQERAREQSCTDSIDLREHPRWIKHQFNVGSRGATERRDERLATLPHERGRVPFGGQDMRTTLSRSHSRCRHLLARARAPGRGNRRTGRDLEQGRVRGSAPVDTKRALLQCGAIAGDASNVLPGSGAQFHRDETTRQARRRSPSAPSSEAVPVPVRPQWGQLSETAQAVNA